ncbi:MAG TPA: PDZ domain-containing protein [Gemmatimonadaceae bacterium]
MTVSWKMPTSGNASRCTLALIGFLVLPLGVQAQRAPAAMVQPPTGWFGVRISDQAMIDEHGNAFFDSYPVVTGVDSSSPAAKAGVRPGDVLLSFNSHDMRGGSVELSKWLKAGAPFVLRIRRNDATRVVRGTLGRRPENWEQNMVVELTVPQILQERSGAIARPQMQRTGMIRTRMPVPEPLPALLPPALGYGGGVYPFAGAEFTALNEDLCDALGVKPEGVFVTNVIEGSAARAAGLRGGDVVIKADSIRIESPIDLVRAIRNADETDRSVDLQIVRKHKAQQLTLRW